MRQYGHYRHYRRLTESQTTDIHFLTGEEQWLELNRNALTCLVSAFRLQANNIVPSSAKTQGQMTRSAAVLVEADSSLGNFGSEPCSHKRLDLKL